MLWLVCLVAFLFCHSLHSQLFLQFESNFAFSLSLSLSLSLCSFVNYASAAIESENINFAGKGEKGDKGDKVSGTESLLLFICHFLTNLRSREKVALTF